MTPMEWLLAALAAGQVIGTANALWGIYRALYRPKYRTKRALDSQAQGLALIARYPVKARLQILAVAVFLWFPITLWSVWRDLRSLWTDKTKKEAPVAGEPYCGAANEPTGLRCSEAEGHDSATLTKGEPVPHSAPASAARESALVWNDKADEPQWQAKR